MISRNRTRFQDNLRSVLTWFLSPKSLGLESDGRHAVSMMAMNISLGYEMLALPVTGQPETTLSLPIFNDQDYLKMDKEYLSPVVEMFRLARKKLYSMLDAFILHGSLATLDYAKGWSDFDTYLIVSKTTLEDPEILCCLRDELIKAYQILLKIDPMQHHGFLVCSAYDIESYPEHYMPIAVLQEGKIFWKKPLQIKPYVDTVRYKNEFLNHVRFMCNAASLNEFRHHALNGEHLQGHFRNAHNAMYQLKNFLEFVSILPCYFLMAEGGPCYKRDSFERVKNRVDDRWNIVDSMSRIREEWGKRESHPYQGNAVPEWLQEMLCPNYLEQGARFAEALGEIIGIGTFARNSRTFFFSRMPKEKKVQDYNAARTELVEHYSTIPDVISLYEYGTCAVPGISDLDVIAVLEDNPSCRTLANAMEHYRPSENLSDLLDGLRVKAVAESHFKQIQLLGEIKTTLLDGRSVQVAALPADIKEMCTVCDVMDWLPERILTLITIVQSENIAVTEFLGHLKSFCITIGKIPLLGFPDSKGISDTLVSIDLLRQNWFASQDTGALLEIAENAIVHGFEIMSRFSSFIVSKEWIEKQSCCPESSFAIRPGQFFRFKKETDCSPVSLFSPNNEGVTIIDVPEIWLSYLMAMGTCSGPLSKIILGNLSSSPVADFPSPDKGLTRVIYIRMELCNAMYNYFRKHNLPVQLLYRFGHLRAVRGAVS